LTHSPTKYVAVLSPMQRSLGMAREY